MRLNQCTAISTPRVLLVPYEPHHVLKYHSWMQDPDIQEATASEPLSIEEEYANQISWRDAPDKLTFIVCLPLSSAPGTVSLIRGDSLYDSADQMVGDVNFFLHQYDDDDDDDADDEEGDEGQQQRLAREEAMYAAGEEWLTGEVDIMIAERASRGRGLGKAAVCAMLVFIHRYMDSLLEEGGDDEAGAQQQPRRRVLKGLQVKIKEDNEGSRALFQKLGFSQQGEVNYFGEIKMALDVDVMQEQEWWQAAVDEYEELAYE